jgi:hypothetical protein
VDLLYKIVDGLEDGLDRVQDALEAETTERQKAAADERQARRAEIQAVSVQLKDFAVGGLRLETIGVWWLFLGLALSTWSQEICRLIMGPPTSGC